MASRIICGDAWREMTRLADESFDCVITSPPYNLGDQKRKRLFQNKPQMPKLATGYDGHDDTMEEDEYISWQRACLWEMFRLIKPTGAIFYNHKWRIQNGLLQERREITEGLPVRQIIIWKQNGGINFNRNYFLPGYEVIYLIAKGGFRLTRYGTHYGDVWEIPHDNKNPHPAPFPLAIPETIIHATQAKRVLDPFAGSGTTGLAAKRNGAEFVLIDKSEQYVEMARSRIDGEKRIKKNLFEKGK